MKQALKQTSVNSETVLKEQDKDVIIMSGELRVGILCVRCGEKLKDKEDAVVHFSTSEAHGCPHGKVLNLYVRKEEGR